MDKYKQPDFVSGLHPQDPNLSFYEDPQEGAYGYSIPCRSSPQHGAPSHPPTQRKCPCPMCYHSLKDPCKDCGCPNSTVPRAMKLNKNLRPVISDQQTASAFFSPSSDYYSLSPDSPPLLQPNDTPQCQLSPQEISQMYAKVNKSSKQPMTKSPMLDTSDDTSLTQSPEPIKTVSSKELDQETLNTSSETSNRNSPTESLTSNISTSSNRSWQINRKNVSSSSVNRKPSMPERISNEDRESRRHSWAGDRRIGSNNKQTTLNDFKKLLSQHSPSSDNSHRISARDLLQKSSHGKDSQPHDKSSHRGAGGSLRKRNTPWMDNRFSVIEEEPDNRDSAIMTRNSPTECSSDV